MSKAKKSSNHELEQQVKDLTLDLQRTRADFENYRKRVEQEKTQVREAAAAGTVLRLLPIIDNLDRALSHVPENLKHDSWAQGVQSLSKNLQKMLENLNLSRINAAPGTEFNPDIHEAIHMDESSQGDKEVITEELQAGYRLGSQVIRHSMVKVARQ